MLQSPSNPAGDARRVDLLGFPGPGQGVLEVASVVSREAEVLQSQRLAGRVADFPGEGQGAAGILGRLGDAGEVPQG